jgi:secondary thiamine-phosphate synthase enzyme
LREAISIRTSRREELVDITGQVQAIVQRSGVHNGLVNVYAQGATAALMIQENWDDSVQTDVVHLLQQVIPRGVWLHDRQDGNGDSHLK